MRKLSWKSVVALMLILSFVGTTALASEYEAQPVQPVSHQEASGGEILVDLALIRPMTFTGMLLGCVTWLVAAPLALIADGGEGFSSVSQTLVVEPFHYTFNRTVGEP